MCATLNCGCAWSGVTGGDATLHAALQLLDDVYACKEAVLQGIEGPFKQAELILRARLFCHVPDAFTFE